MYAQPSSIRTDPLPLVLEIGEFSTKGGFAGEDKPSYISPTVFLTDKDLRDVRRRPDRPTLPLSSHILQSGSLIY
jgi:actin-related protein